MGLLKYFGLVVGALAVCEAAVDTVVKDYHGKEFLDPKEKVQLEWTVDWRQRTLFFNITVETNGWIGMGFSKDGTMKEADIVIAGVNSGGTPYISDLHTDCHRNLIPDNQQDWTLHAARENGAKTILQVSRLIDTCDSDDYTITDDLVYMIYAWGLTDTVTFHHDRRGSFRIYLLDPVMHSSTLAKVSPTWKASKKVPVPPKRTTYWCSIHKKPSTVTQKHHIIEFRAVLENQMAVAHTHHFVFWKCLAPPGADARAIFEPLVSLPGEECYFNKNHKIPIQLCRTMIYVWAIGGNPLIFPDNVGVPFGDFPDEYYMLESHYDNPEEITGLAFEAGVEAVYTNQLRPQDAGSIIVTYDLFGFFMVPPGTQEFQLSGHCGSECTNQMIPTSGIDIFAVHFHTHFAGRKAKLRHSRNGVELPWVMKDDNYAWSFQQPRPLHRVRRVLPGDHLTMTCEYDNTWTNITTFAGFATFNEMCLATVYHTNPMPYYTCGSAIPQTRLLNLIGVQNVTWNPITQQRVVSSPANLQNQTLAHIGDDLTVWTDSLRAKVAAVTSTSPQMNSCPIITPPNGTLSNVMALSRGYGVKQLFGTVSVPHITPGPHARATHPTLRSPYSRNRYCPAQG